jgi:ribosomal protein S27E
MSYIIVSYENIYRNQELENMCSRRLLQPAYIHEQIEKCQHKTDQKVYQTFSMTIKCRKCLDKLTVATAGKGKCFNETHIHKHPLFYSILRQFNPVSYPIFLDPF